MRVDGADLLLPPCRLQTLLLSVHDPSNPPPPPPTPPSHSTYDRISCRSVRSPTRVRPGEETTPQERTAVHCLARGDRHHRGVCDGVGGEASNLGGIGEGALGADAFFFDAVSLGGVWRERPGREQGWGCSPLCVLYRSSDSSPGRCCALVCECRARCVASRRRESPFGC